MDYYAVCFSYEADGVKSKTVDIKTKGKNEAIKPALPLEGRPAVFLFVWVYLNDLLEHPDTERKIIVRKKNDSRIELFRMFPQTEQIPLLAAYYQGPGRVKQVVNTFLKRMHEHDTSSHRDVFFLGVRKRIFSTLWQELDGKALPIEFNKLPDTEPQVNLFSVITDRERQPAPSRIDTSISAHKFLGNSEQARRIREQCRRCAVHDEPVLLLGESGTGKGLIAHDIHNLSSRRNHNFVTINCGAIPEGIFESLLFGIKGGIATGVNYQQGKLREADQGTLFLDEIADLPKFHQVKLLHFLEDKRVTPLGGSQNDTVTVDARIISATNSELDVLVREGSFRLDLYMRLRGILIRTPPLREQKDIIPELAQHLWKNTIMNDKDARLPDDIIQELCDYGFPGNYRELKNILRNLHFYYLGEKELTVEHLRNLFREYRLTPLKKELRPEQQRASVAEELSIKRPASAESLSAQDELLINKVKCLRTLKFVAEWIHAMELTLEPLIDQRCKGNGARSTVMKILPERLLELEALLRKPTYFYTYSTYETISGIKAKLAYFNGLIDEGQNDVASNLLNDDIVPEMKKATNSILLAVNDLLKS